MLLCIWFPSESGVLTLDLVESWCGHALSELEFYPIIGNGGHHLRGSLGSKRKCACPRHRPLLPFRSICRVLYRAWLKGGPQVAWMMQAGQAEVVRNRRDKFHQTWGPPFSLALYNKIHNSTAWAIMSDTGFAGSIFWIFLCQWKFNFAKAYQY